MRCFAATRPVTFALCVLSMTNPDKKYEHKESKAGFFWLGAIFLFINFYLNLEHWKLGEDMYFPRSLVALFSPGLALWLQGMLGFICLLFAVSRTYKLIRNT